GVVGLLGGHGADDRHPLHVPGDAGEALTDADAGDGGGDLLGGPAVGVAGLEGEGVHLAGSAGHPQEGAVLLARRQRGGGGRARFEPAGRRGAEGAGGRKPQPVAAGQTGGSHGGSPEGEESPPRITRITRKKTGRGLVWSAAVLLRRSCFSSLFFSLL